MSDTPDEQYIRQRIVQKEIEKIVPELKLKDRLLLVEAFEFILKELNRLKEIEKKYLEERAFNEGFE